MAIQLTEKAAKQIQEQLAKRGRGIGLRLGVKKVGCSGFAYTYDYADEVRDGEKLFETFDTKVVVDGESLSFLDGSTLDFVREGLKQIFKVENPNVDALCGCGESFSVKEKVTGTPQGGIAKNDR
ncbi:MAG: iron-sulfur cluster assembly accessory protein [Betaproteobacteria bacterium]|nr:iron-sulfur cluster assembly accessory protein [Betaproteobacteria bacterium]